MFIKRTIQSLGVASIVGLAVLAGSLAAAQQSKDKPAKGDGGHGQPGLPPEAQEHMRACIEAGTPGKWHEWLGKQVGVWEGSSQLWMGPTGGEPARGTCTWTVTRIFEGRYLQAALNAELPGMGTFSGLGFTGFDNVSQKFVGSWLDSHSTGIMQGVGELSKDGKRLDWKYTQNCPLSKKPIIVRQVDHFIDADTIAFEMFTIDPPSGKEYKCMRVDFTRKK